MKSSADESLMTECRLHIFKLYGLLLKETEDTLNTTKLTRSRNLLLGVIARAGRPMTASQIAHEMGQTRQGVGRLVKLLEKDGYVQFSDNPYRRSSKLINLTVMGNETYKTVHELHLKLTEAHPFPVDNEALQTTCNVLGQLIEHMETDHSAY